MRLSVSRTIGHLLVLCFLIANAAHAQLPTGRLTTVFPAGGQQGSTFTCRIVSSADLDETKTLWFSHPGIRAVPTNDGIEGSSEFHVSVDSSVPTGIYEVRAGGLYGLSNPRLFLVGSEAEATEKEPNNTRETAAERNINTTVNGQIGTNGDVDWYRFSAKAGQRVLVECFARSLDSRLAPRLDVYDPTGKRIARAIGNEARDALADITAASDGEFFVRVSEQTFRGSNEHVYRLSIHTRPHIDFVLPSSVLPGRRQPITVYGRNLPGGKPTRQSIDGRVLESVTADVIAPARVADLRAEMPITSSQAGVDGFMWRLQASNSVLLQFANSLPVIEKEPNSKDAPQQISVPGEVAGQFQQPDDLDVFEFAAKKGQSFSIEVFGQRAGSTADPYFVLERIETSKDGKVALKRVTAQDDTSANIGGNDFFTANGDPFYRFAIPKDDRYRISLRDRYSDSRGSPDLVYRLAIREPRKDFRVFALAGRTPGAENQLLDQGAISVRRGGHYEVALMAIRRDGFAEPVTFIAENLPPGVSARNVTLGTGQSRTIMVFSAEENAATGFHRIQIRGVAKIDSQQISRIARSGTVVRKGDNSASLSRLSQSLMLSVLPDTPALRVQTNSQRITVNQSQQMFVPIEIAKRHGFDNNVTILWTGQPPNFDIESKAIAKGQTNGSFRLFAKNNAPPGIYALVAHGKASVPFRRNPWKLKRETDSHARIVAELTAATEKVKASKANEAKLSVDVANLRKQQTAAAQLVTALDEKIKKARQAVAKSIANEKAVTLAVGGAMKMRAARKAAANALAKAAQLADDKDLNQKVKEANALVVAGDKFVAAAKQKSLTAKAAIQNTNKQLEAAMAEHRKAVSEAKAYPAKIAAAEKLVPKAAAMTKAIQAAMAELNKRKIQADKKLKVVQNQTKQINVNVYEPAEPVMIQVVKSPILLTANVASGGNVKAGASIEIGVKVKRNGYDGPIKVGIDPSDAKSIAAPFVEIAAGQTDGKLKITAGGKAAKGVVPHLVVRAKFQSDREYTVDVPIKVQVQK